MKHDLFGEAPTPFKDDAYSFLVRYAKRMRGRSFCAEDVTLAALDAGLAPHDLRIWGPIFVQAAKDGFIRRSREAFPRSRGNGTLALGWMGV